MPMGESTEARSTRSASRADEVCWVRVSRGIRAAKGAMKLAFRDYASDLASRLPEFKSRPLSFESVADLPSRTLRGRRIAEMASRERLAAFSTVPIATAGSIPTNQSQSMAATLPRRERAMRPPTGDHGGCRRHRGCVHHQYSAPGGRLPVIFRSTKTKVM